MSSPSAPAQPAAVPPWIPLVVAGVVTAMHVWKLPGVMTQVQADLAMSLVDVGLLMGIVQLASILLGLAVSLAADLIGLRRTLLLGLGALALGSAVGAFSTTPGMLMTTRAFEGVGFVLVTVVAPALVRRETSPQEVAGAMGWWAAFQGTAVFLAVLASTLLVTGPVGLGWRAWWVLMAALTFAVAVPVLLRVPRDPHHGHDDAAAHLRVALGRTGRTARVLSPWVLGVVFGSYTMQWAAVLTFLPRVLTAAGVSALAAGVALAVVGLCNGVGNVITGRLVHRGVPYRTLVAVGLAWVAVSTVLFFAVDWAAVPGGLAIAVLLAGTFSFVSATVPSTLTNVIVRVAPEDGSPAAAVGIMTQVFNVGNLVGPVILAALADRFGGWGMSWLMTVGAAAVGLALTLFVVRFPPQHAAASPRG